MILLDWLKMYGDEEVLIGTQAGELPLMGARVAVTDRIYTRVTDGKLWLALAAHAIHPERGARLMRRLYGEAWGDFTLSPRVPDDTQPTGDTAHGRPLLQLADDREGADRAHARRDRLDEHEALPPAPELVRPGQKPPSAPPRMNGVALGPGSPLLASPAPRTGKVAETFTMSEFTVQAGLVELLVGPIGTGDRQPGAGMTGRYPCLLLLYAVPNGAAARSKAAAGKRKAEGQLRGMPDLCLPVARSHYHALYLETKKANAKARAQQQVIHAMLRAEGNCVLVFDNVQMGLDLTLAYLKLEPGQSLTSHV